MSAATRASAPRLGAGVAGGLLVATTLLLALPIGRRHGRGAAMRFAATAAGVVVCQQALVATALRRQARRGGPGALSAVDLLTLSRGLAAALLAGLVASGVRRRTGYAAWTGWISLAAGSVLCDWLDGPIARRLGSSPAGAIFDLEADSWLTLTAGLAGVAWGDLPAYCLAAPASRYLLLTRALRHVHYREIFAAEPPWARWSGIAQMLLFTASLAPFGGRLTGGLVKGAAPIVAPAQLGVMLALHQRLRLGRPKR
jgi:phosphatidylglycerophosphate synthase